MSLSDDVVTLRPWSRDDAGFIADASGDPAIQRYSAPHDRRGHPSPPESIAAAEALIEEFAANWRASAATGRPSGVTFAITDAASGELAGFCGVDAWSDEDVVQIRTIAEQVSEITGAPVSFAEGAGPDVRNYQVDFTKIRSQVPAFEPQWTIPQGIQEIWTDAAERGLTAEDFEGPRFVRLRRIQQLAAEGRLDLADLRLSRTSVS